jgi:hypothetical protein
MEYFWNDYDTQAEMKQHLPNAECVVLLFFSSSYSSSFRSPRSFPSRHPLIVVLKLDFHLNAFRPTNLMTREVIHSRFNILPNFRELIALLPIWLLDYSTVCSRIHKLHPFYTLPFLPLPCFKALTQWLPPCPEWTSHRRRIRVVCQDLLTVIQANLVTRCARTKPNKPPLLF